MQEIKDIAVHYIDCLKRTGMSHLDSIDAPPVSKLPQTHHLVHL